MASVIPDTTALILPVPAADPIVGPWRARYDRTAHEGVPAHVTLLYPFLTPDAITRHQLERLTKVLGSIPPFPITMTRTEVLTDILTLALDPYSAMERLRDALLARWPMIVPYDGKYGPRPRMHVTVAWGAQARPDGAQDFTMIEADIGPMLPIRETIGSLWLMERRAGVWSQRSTYRLGG